MLSGDNGILQKATDAKTNTERAEAKEQARMDIMAYIADKTANHQDASLDDAKIQEILSDNKSYVKKAGDTSFTTKKGEYVIPYSELYQSSSVTPSTPTDNFATLKTTLEKSSQDNVQINEKGEIFEIEWEWYAHNDEECEICGIYSDEDDDYYSGYKGTIKNGELKNGFPIFIKSNNKTYRVTKIGESALDSNNDIEKIIIPEGITQIGDDAFQWCRKLKDVTLPNSLKSIGERAFTFTDLQNINISQEIIRCGAITFNHTPWLTSQPDGSIYIGKVFYGYKGTIPSNTTITINDGTVRIAGGGYYKIFDSAGVDYSGIKSIVIPESVIEIPQNAFNNCTGLTSITINKSIDSIFGAPWGAPNMTANDVTWSK